MIDSVCLTLPIRMHSPREMISLGFASACKHPSLSCRHPARWTFHPQSKPHLTWSEAPDRSHWLSFTGSLPRFFFGSNVYLMATNDELQTCLAEISQYVSDAAQVVFDCLQANVTRVHYCQDWRLSSDWVANYLWALRDLSLPRMKRTLIDNSTIQLSNAAQTICFYNKLEERLARKSVSPPELEAANGILRFETRFNDNRACQRHARRLGLANRKVENLLNDLVAKQTLSFTLKRLGLDKPIRTGSERMEALKNYCGEDRAKLFRLTGFLVWADKYGPENLVRLGLCSYSDFRRKLKELQASGVFHVSDEPRSLAPLTFESVRTSRSSEAA